MLLYSVHIESQGGSLAQVLHDAINESNETGYRLDVYDLYQCPKCNGIASYHEKCDCGYMSQQYIDKQQKWADALAKIDAMRLHQGPLDQEIFGM